jgi:dolichol kinase
MFEKYKNTKDRGKYVLSHIYMLMACLYPSFFLNNPKNYLSVLISACILDSFASIIGIFFKSDKKSFIGFVGGVVLSNFVYFLIFKTFDRFSYFIFIGLIEYSTKHNDNIIIPYLSVLYFISMERQAL